MKLLNYVMRALMWLFAIITAVVTVVPYALTMLFAHLDEITDK